jgi:membrane fusion protein (multidrug efflux system)
MFMKKSFVIIVLLGVFCALTWLVWFRPIAPAAEEKKPEADVPVHVATIRRGTLHSYVTAYGALEAEPTASARVAPAMAGLVVSVKCVEGQRVEQGTLLFQLDSRAADVAVNFAEKTLERQQRLLKIEGASQKSLQEAEQALAAARTQQALLQIRSPLAGVVTKVNAKAGEAADLTTVLAEVVDPDRLMASANVSSAELAAVRAGQAVEVIPADSSTNVNAALTYSSSQVDPKSGSGLVRASIPSGTGLRPGQFVKLRIITEEHKDCLTVPTVSVGKDPTGSTFIAIVEGERAVLKPVKVGIQEGDLIEIEGEGVEADKTVVTEGAYGLIMTQQFATKIRVVND